MGYGLLEDMDDQPRMVECGVLTARSTCPSQNASMSFIWA